MKLKYEIDTDLGKRYYKSILNFLFLPFLSCEGFEFCFITTLLGTLNDPKLR